MLLLIHSRGRCWEPERLTFVSRSSRRVSSLFWAALPSWSSLTIRMMWFQLNSRIRSNQTWAWWEYGGTVRRKDRWMLCGVQNSRRRLIFWPLASQVWLRTQSDLISGCFSWSIFFSKVDAALSGTVCAALQVTTERKEIIKFSVKLKKANSCGRKQTNRGETEG